MRVGASSTVAWEVFQSNEQRNQKAGQEQGVTKGVWCVLCFQMQKYLKGNTCREKEKQHKL